MEPNKFEFIIFVQNTIKENPSWTADLILAITNGLKIFAENAIKTQATARIVIDTIPKKELKKLKNKFNPKMFDEKLINYIDNL